VHRIESETEESKTLGDLERNLFQLDRLQSLIGLGNPMPLGDFLPFSPSHSLRPFWSVGDSVEADDYAKSGLYGEW
jgi:hypothetical protein